MFDENYIMTSILGLLGIIAWSKHLFFLKYISTKVEKLSLVLLIVFVIWGVALNVAISATSGHLDESTYKLVQDSIKAKDVPTTWFFFVIGVLVWNSILEWVAQKLMKHDEENA
ncbi:TPA: hypothetical protein AB5E57_003467 [Vibrio cholerae]|uniref:hypothetical protein n=1 Tax=Vibrio metoecus TaxID=1481663 RepID=UPI0006D779E1|nr:hypothetical protein [Vibrio metoecus]KQA16448.1 hypothetical protein AAY52_16835 [Vibrio metoecus]